MTSISDVIFKCEQDYEKCSCSLENILGIDDCYYYENGECKNILAQLKELQNLNDHLMSILKKSALKK